MQRFLTALLVLGAAAVSPAAAELAPIQMDGDFSDWSALAPAYSDPVGDVGNLVDFGDVWLANDQDWLYISFETGGEVQPDEQQDIRIYLDTDDDPDTGFSYRGLGAELIWYLGDRSGTFYRGGTTGIDHPDIGLVVNTTVSGTRFELALRRDAVPAGGQALFPGATVNLLLRDGASGGDLAPAGDGIPYTFAAGALPVPSLDLDRADPGHLRLATWNVEGDGLFDGGAHAAQDRLLQVMDPDVLVVNEVWSHSAAEVRDEIAGHLTGGQWYATGDDGGNVIVSRLPILQSWLVSPGDRITAALLDAGPDPAPDLLVIANHWSCCTADANRQAQADAVIAFLRDAKLPGGAVTLPAGTPFLLAGDLNLVGWRQQLETILTGDIQDEGTYGADAAPDWDGGDFEHPLSRHADARLAYTWRKDTSSYYPGVLDYILYTDSALQLHNHYVLETRTMTGATLAAYGLLESDTALASDHAARVADFSLTAGLSAVPSAPVNGAAWARLLPNTPNPFNPGTRLRLALERPGTVRLGVYDLRGRLVREFAPQVLAAGEHGVAWDGRDQAGRAVSSGVYRVRMTVADGRAQVADDRTITLIE